MRRRINARQLRESIALLKRCRGDYDRAVAGFAWPVTHPTEPFNFATDVFDERAREADRDDALTIVDHHEEREDRVSRASWGELSRRSNQVANMFLADGFRARERVMVMLGNRLELWETLLGNMKIGCVSAPATTMLSADDVRDRVLRGRISRIVVEASNAARVRRAAGDLVESITVVADGTVAEMEPRPRHRRFEECAQFPTTTTVASHDTLPHDEALLFFTSGTTSKPKMVIHTHRSYAVGHLSTMYWLGIGEGDVHYNLSSAGWAKHAWSSFFAPFLAKSSVFSLNQPRFSAKPLLEALVRYGVTSFCAPPTVYRSLVLEDLAAYARHRELKIASLVSAGEPLNPEIVRRFERDWNITIREGFGLTETTAMIGTTPGMTPRAGSLGRALPGYAGRLSLRESGALARSELPPLVKPGETGELFIERNGAAGVMARYERGEDGIREERVEPSHHHFGDLMTMDEEGYFYFVGRNDDVFKSSDYKVSPFELESTLLECTLWVVETAVVAVADPIRGFVPKAFVVRKGVEGRGTDELAAREIFAHSRRALSPFKRVRIVEFVETLPKTVSGKIRRVELRVRGKSESELNNNRDARVYHERDFFSLTSEASS